MGVIVQSEGKIGLKLVDGMAAITLDRIRKEGIENAEINQKHVDQGNSLRNLRGNSLGKSDCAVVIAAGPSLHRMNIAEQLKSHKFDGAIVTTESAMRYCLKQGIIPDLVVSLDPHAKRIVRWFGDPDLTIEDLKQDDYFSRQDMDKAFSDELRANDEMLELLDKHGKDIRIALATSASDAVVKRVLEVGMDVYWWNPMYDDPSSPNSVTMRLYKNNGLPCLNAGGNVGAACWVISHGVLGKRHVAVTGMDFSYYADTPHKNTQYYYEAIALVGEENLEKFFIKIFNPHLNQWFYTDPTYMWYRNILLEMAADAECITYNCTEGGILFGKNINFIKLKEFLVDRQACR